MRSCATSSTASTTRSSRWRKKYNILGMPVPTEYGGRGADTVTYARALARIGREGTGVRTFFSGHTSSASTRS